MLLLVVLLLIGLVSAEEKCKAATPRVTLPECTKLCLSSKNNIYNDTCADNLVGFCSLSDGIRVHMNKYGLCIRDACPDKADRQLYLETFQYECNLVKVVFTDGTGPNDFRVNDLVNDTPWPHTSTATSMATSTGVVETASTRTGADDSSIIATNPATSATNTADESTTFVTSTSQSSTLAEPSPPPATSTPDQSSPSTPAQGQPSKSADQPTSAAVGVPPSNSKQATPIIQLSDVLITTTSHGTVTVITTHIIPQSTGTAAAASPTFSTPALAGTVAGGTAGLALIISLIYILMRRRKRRQSYASSSDIWELSLPKLGKPEPDSRYSSVGTSAQMRQHSAGIPSPPSNSSPAQSYASPRDPFTAPGEQSRYYNHAQRPEQPLHRQASNIDSRYPTLSSPTGPISETSTMHNWQPSGVPVPGIKLSHPDLRGDGVRSPVSELGGNRSVRKVRSANLHGVEVMSPVSQLGYESKFEGSGNGAAEWGGDAPKKVVEVEGSTIHKPYRGGVSTNF